MKNLAILAIAIVIIFGSFSIYAKGQKMQPDKNSQQNYICKCQIDCR